MSEAPRERGFSLSASARALLRSAMEPQWIDFAGISHLV
jgi:hypothetical protein